jgi:hypothetical protein
LLAQRRKIRTGYFRLDIWPYHKNRHPFPRGSSSGILFIGVDFQAAAAPT